MQQPAESDTNNSKLNNSNNNNKNSKYKSTESDETTEIATNDKNSQKTAHKKILFFMHFHKAGGHSICKTAAKNGLRIPKGTNCNAFVTDSKNPYASKKMSCCGHTVKEQQDFARKSMFTFVANEQSLFEELDTEYFEYMVVFRDPWSRYASHYKYARDFFFGAKVLGSFETWVSAQPDNYLLRSLCGPFCAQVPTGQLTEEHLQFAKDRLDKFSAVLILENLTESMKIMEKRFHWKPEEEAFHGNANKKSQDQIVATDDIMKRYHYLVTFDNELYEYARYLSKRQIEQYVHRSAYSELQCENSCCAETCSKYRK